MTQLFLSAGVREHYDNKDKSLRFIENIFCNVYKDSHHKEMVGQVKVYMNEEQ